MYHGSITDGAAAAGHRQPVVQMAHVDVAVTEMFRAVHMQLLGSCCRLEKLLLAALVIDMRASGTAAIMHALSFSCLSVHAWISAMLSMNALRRVQGESASWSRSQASLTIYVYDKPNMPGR